MSILNKFPAFLVAGLLALAGQATGQLPAPFSSFPADYGLVARIDFQQINQDTTAAPILQNYKTTNPQIQNSLLNKAFEESGAAGFQFPGEVMIYEMGVPAASMDAAAVASGPGAAAEPPDMQGAFVCYGRIDAAKFAQALPAASFTESETYEGLKVFAGPAKDVFLTMPNEWTLAVAERPEDLRAIIDVTKGKKPSLAGTNAGILRNANSYFFAAATVTPNLKAKLEKTAAAPPPQAMMLAGLPAVFAEMKNFSAGAIALQGPNNLNLNFDLLFADEGSARRASDALNQLFTAVAAMNEMQAQRAGQLSEQDQRMLAEFKAFKFVPSGASATGHMRIPADVIPKVVEGAEMALQMGMAEQRRQQSAAGGTP
ncbi:hypothetical protein HZA57_07445 [Candidatus Poribacteria bacterium]|nr:hypothetical protein [Candidatus Poribacteria bacterium]